VQSPKFELFGLPVFPNVELHAVAPSNYASACFGSVGLLDFRSAVARPFARVFLQTTRVKGTALIGVVAALRPAAQRTPELVAEPLRHYLHDELLDANWYSFDDYLALMRILASTIDPAKAKGDVYRAFGVIAAQRDLRGEQSNVPAEQRPKTAGLYSGSFARVTGLASLVRRGLHLREIYYSRGYYKVKRVSERKLEVTLHDFPPSAELCAVSTGYLTEVFRSTKVGIWVERVSCCGNGDADCRWELRFGDTTDVSDLAVFESFE
jgi:hypothetical protein